VWRRLFAKPGNTAKEDKRWGKFYVESYVIWSDCSHYLIDTTSGDSTPDTHVRNSENAV